MELPNLGKKKDDGKLTPKAVTEAYEAAIKSIAAETQDYWLNCAFLVGKQWVYWNKSSRRLDNYEDTDPGRVQAVMNRIWPASRTTVSKVLQRDLTFEVLPSAPDDATMRGATTAEAILHDVHQAHGWEKIRTKNTWATWKGGTAAICVDWDPKAGSHLGDMTGEDGESPVFQGDTVETPLSIAEFAVEPGVRDPRKARYWIKAQALPPKNVQALYGMAETPPADAIHGMSPIQQMMVAEENSSGNQKPELTRVLTYYERPNGLNPKGSVAVLVDNKFVDGPKDWPFPFKDHLNFAVTYETDVESRWTGETVVSQARPVQVLYNLALSNIAEHLKNAGNARMVVPQSMIDLMETMSDLPGEMLPKADSMESPSWISPPQMPAWWSEWPSRLADTMDDLLGVHNVSRGDAPANIESGYGLSVLAEHDSTPVGRLVKNQAEAWSEVATMVLQLYAHMVPAQETRTSMIRSSGEVPEAVSWSGKDLEGQTTAIVPPDAIIPRSRAAMQQAAEKMVQMGLVTDLETYAALTELPGQKYILDRARPDVAKARRENSAMALGRPEIPADFDEHQIHIAEHNVFRKSSRYEKMPAEQQEVVDNHIQAHTTMAAELAGRSRAGAAIDPMMASVPQPDSRPTLDPAQLPPDALSLAAPGADEPFLEEDPALELADLASQAASV